MTSPAPIVELDALRVWHASADEPVRAVDGVSLQIGPGEVVGLVGESGCGKSTLARAILGLLPATSATDGRTLVAGIDMATASERERRRLRGREVAIVFQDPMTRLDPLVTVGRHLLETLAEHRPRSSRDERRRRCEALLASLGLPAQRMAQYPHELSGGMRQRVGMALALVSDPRLVIADEPTTALDPVLREQVLALLRERCRRSDASVLLISHDLAAVARWCDRVAVMYAGRIVEEGEAAAVLGAPAHPYTRELLASAVAMNTAALRGIPGVPPDLRRPPSGCRFHPRCPDVLSACAQRDPEERALGKQRVSCWLHA